MTVTHVVADWGTTNFRLWALDRSGMFCAERRSAEGLATAQEVGFERVLESHLDALGVDKNIPAVLCGMVGSRTGWTEAPYCDCPVRLDDLTRHSVPVPGTRRPVRILPGIAQRDARHPDVMRGEETHLLALAAECRTGLVCLPGTHSKWVRLSAGSLDGFATFMTGELFRLLGLNSIIAPALESGSVDPESKDFRQGVVSGLTESDVFTSRLFELRASWLLSGAGADAALATLSGLLIGIEIAGAKRRFGPLDGVALVASGETAPLYAQALAIAGVRNAVLRDADSCVRQGLRIAAQALFPAAERVSP